MKFFSVETCKKFVEMGLVSQSKFVWTEDQSGEWFIKYKPKGDLYHYQIPAFQPQIDFLGDGQAVDNAKKLWGEEVESLCEELSSPQNKVYMVTKGWRGRRIDMLDAPDQIEFVESFIKGVG